MNCEDAERWMTIISEDLREARHNLTARSGAAEAFLLARIAENEAILKRLEKSEHADGAYQGPPALGYWVGDPAQAA
jgi:hypothetical protein